jgi:hypothetical protein
MFSIPIFTTPPDGKSSFLLRGRAPQGREITWRPRPYREESPKKKWRVRYQLQN